MKQTMIRGSFIPAALAAALALSCATTGAPKSSLPDLPPIGVDGIVLVDPLPEYPRDAASPASDTFEPPAWTVKDGSPLVFVDESGYKATGPIGRKRARAILRGFFGVARGLGLDGDAVLIERFELEAPPGARYTAIPLPGETGQPPDAAAPAFAALRVEASGFVGVAVADLGRKTVTDLSGNAAESGGFALRFDGVRLTVDGMEWSDAGLLLRSGSVGPDTPYGARSAAVDYRDLRVEPGWKPDVASGTLSTGQVELPGLGRVPVERATLERLGDGAVLLRAVVPPEAELEGGRIVPLDSFAMGTGGALSDVVGRGELEYGSAPGWRVVFRLTGFGDDAVEGEGRVTLPESFGGADFDAPRGALTSTSLGRGSFAAGELDGPVPVVALGWDAMARGVTVKLEPDGFASFDARACVVESGTFAFPVGSCSGDTAKGLSFGDSTVDGRGETRLPFFGGRTRLGTLSIRSGAVAASIFVDLPDAQGGSTLEFGKVTFGPDGSWTCDPLPAGMEMAVDGSRLRLGALTLEPELIRADGIEIAVESPAAVSPIGAAAATLLPDGSIDVDEPREFSFAGATVHPERIAFRDGSTRVTGTLEVPAGFPEGVSGKTLDLSRLRFPAAGGAPDFVTKRLAGGLSMPYGNGILDAAGMRVEFAENALVAVLDGCSLAVHERSPLASAYFDGVRAKSDGSLSWRDASLSGDLVFRLGGALIRLRDFEDIDGEIVALSGIGTVVDPQAVKGTIPDFEVTSFVFSAVDGRMLSATGIIRGVEVDLFGLFGTPE